jgi:hypothetical protein
VDHLAVVACNSFNAGNFCPKACGINLKQHAEVFPCNSTSLGVALARLVLTDEIFGSHNIGIGI